MTNKQDTDSTDLFGHQRGIGIPPNPTHVRIIPHTDLAQVVITSDCFHSMRACEIEEVGLLVAGILGLRLGWGDKREQIRRLFAPYEAQHRKEVATILELGLWKAKMEETDCVDPRIREECRVKCGAAVVIEKVLPFL